MSRTKEPPEAQAPAPPTQELLELRRIHPSPLNPRKHFDEAKLAELAASIRAHGLLQALVVRPEGAGRWTVVAGERRRRAALLAGLRLVPCRVVELDDRAALEVMVVENDARSDVTPLERAAGYAALLEEHQVKVEDLAQRVGRSESAIRSLVKLHHNLPDLARVAVERGHLPTAVAELIARVPGQEARQELALHVLWGNSYQSPAEEVVRAHLERGTLTPLNYRQTRELIRRDYVAELGRAPFSRKALDLVPGVPACDECPKRAGNLKRIDAQAAQDYEGVRDDVCTDPDCYRSKCTAHAEQLKAAATAAGQQVLEGKEAEQLWDYSGRRLRDEAPYVDLAEQHYGDTAKRPRSYKQLLKGRLEESAVVLALDETGQPHRLYPRAAAAEVLQQEHGLRLGGGAPGRNGQAKSEEEKRAEKARKEKARLERETDRELLRRAAAEAELLFGQSSGAGLRRIEVLRCLAALAWQECWGDRKEAVARRRQWEGKGALERDKAAAAAIAGMDGAALAGLLAELAVARTALGYDPHGQGKGLVKALQLPARKDLEREVKARLKQEAEAKKAGKNGKANGQARPSLKKAAAVSAGPVEIGARVRCRDGGDCLGWVTGTKKVPDSSAGNRFGQRVESAYVEWDLMPGEKEQAKGYWPADELIVVARAGSPEALAMRKTGEVKIEAEERRCCACQKAEGLAGHTDSAAALLPIEVLDAGVLVAIDLCPDHLVAGVCRAHGWDAAPSAGWLCAGCLQAVRPRKKGART